MVQSKPVRFIQESAAELKKVVWPTREQLVRLTLLVIIVSAVSGLLIGGLDYLFTKLLSFII